MSASDLTAWARAQKLNFPIYFDSSGALFNEFGINLRKNKMLDQSLEYYQRAMELSQKDENLFYNIARVYLEKKDFHKTVSCLLQTMELNPELEAGIKFLQWMKEKNLVPADQAEAVDAILASVNQ